MFVASYRNTMRSAKLPRKEIVEKPQEEKRTLSLKEPDVRFFSKRVKTKAHRKERAETAARAEAVDRLTAALVKDAADSCKPMSAIIVDVARKFGVSTLDIKGPCKAIYIVAVRQHAMVRVYLAHEGISPVTMMGRAFGGKDHTTILSVMKKYRAGMPQRKSVKNRVPEEVNERILAIHREHGYPTRKIASMVGVSSSHVCTIIQSFAKKLQMAA